MTDDCPKIDGCPIFEHFNSDNMSNFWASSFCQGEYPDCERFQLAESGENVPTNMLPNRDYIEHMAD